MSDQIVGLFSFHERTIMSAFYLNILENFMFPQTVAEAEGPIFKKDGAPAQFVPLYVLLWMNHFLVSGSAGEGGLIGLRGVLI
jgi:hypothetical protein